MTSTWIEKNTYCRIDLRKELEEKYKDIFDENHINLLELYELYKRKLPLEQKNERSI